MRNLAKKGGHMWVVLAFIPMAAFANIIGKAINLDSSIIIGIGLPTLALQWFSLFMSIQYRREIFN